MSGPRDLISPRGDHAIDAFERDLAQMFDEELGGDDDDGN